MDKFQRVTLVKASQITAVTVSRGAVIEVKDSKNHVTVDRLWMSRNQPNVGDYLMEDQSSGLMSSMTEAEFAATFEVLEDREPPSAQGLEGTTTIPGEPCVGTLTGAGTQDRIEETGRADDLGEALEELTAQAESTTPEVDNTEE